MTPREIERRLAKVARTRWQIDEAAAAHHDAIVQALAAGATQRQLAAALEVSPQAISEYVRRWIKHPRVRFRPDSAQGTLL